MKGNRIMYSALALAEAPAASNWVQIMRTGKWKHPKHGDMEITTADLHKFKENFDNNVRGVKLFTDVAHKPDDGSIAQWEALRVDGDKLYAKMAWTEEGAELVKSGKYQYFSPEFAFTYTDPETGKKYQDVLLGGGVTNRPFLKNMAPIQLSEDAPDDSGLLFLSDYDPDGDGDDDSTADPEKNPDWKDDVRIGVLPWSKLNADQQGEMQKSGFTEEHSKAACAAFKKRGKVKPSQVVDPSKVQMSEDDLTQLAKLVAVQLAEGNVTNGHKSPPKGKPTDKSQYADPENYKYPIDEKHIHAAVSYFNHDGMQSKGGYSSEQWASIGGKIAAAANRLIGKGYSFKDGKIETPPDHDKSKATMSLDEYMGTKATNPEDGTSAAGSPDDTDAGKFEEPKGGNGMETVALSEFQAEQAKVKSLEGKLRHMELSETVKGFVAAGKIAPAQQDETVAFMETMTDEQVAKFTEMVEKQTAVQFGEVGSGTVTGGKPNEQQKADAVFNLAEKYEREQGMAWKDAFIKASEDIDAGVVK